MSFEPELPWDSPKFREKNDTPWTAGCRWLASWWREQQGIQPGERSFVSESLVGAMFPFDTGAEHNFFSPRVIASVEDRVLEGAEFGIVSTEVLFRSLLETQVLLFNLIGEFRTTPNALLPWIRTVDESASEVTDVRLEWQPDRRLHVGGGPGFDAFIEYRSRLRGAKRFVGLECTYAEDPERSTLTAKPKHVDATEESAHWRSGAPRRLDRAPLRRYWIPTLVAQSMIDAGEYDAGRVVAMSCAANPAPDLAVSYVRAELVDPDGWLVLSSYDALVDALEPSEPEWAAYMRRRYLDFSPVVHLLDADDPRGKDPHQAVDPSETLRRLASMGKVRPRFANAEPSEIEALEVRAADLVADLDVFWDALRRL